MPRPALEITDLVKRYGAVDAVAGLSLTAASSEVTAVLGPNGAGKTTTLEICEGFRTADAGAVRVLGLDPRRDAGRLRPRLGVMLQSGGVYGAVSATTALHHAQRLHAHPHSPDALLEVLGLGPVARTPFRRLSGGEQQRVLLALALIGRPELVFLDEPTAGLDPQARRGVWDLVRQLRTDGVTLVLTTHYLEEAEELADHVVIVDHGRVVAEGSPGSLMGDGEETLTFQAPANLPVDSLTAALPGGAAARETAPGRYQVTGRVDPQLLALVTAWCAERSVMPRELRTDRRSLEDVFLELTGRELRP